MPGVIVVTDSADAERKLARLRRMPQTGIGRLRELADDILHRMQVPGYNPPVPINWASPQQHIAWFASDGFTLPLHGRPKGYRNTHDIYTRRGVDSYESGWTESPMGDTGVLVENVKPEAGYITGNAEGVGQSPIHVGRWRVFAEQVVYALRRLPQVVRDIITEIMND